MLRYINTTTNASLHASKHFLDQPFPFFFFLPSPAPLRKKKNNYLKTKLSLTRHGASKTGDQRVSQHQHQGQIKTKWFTDMFVPSL